MNTLEQRRISHELVEAWEDVYAAYGPFEVPVRDRMHGAMDAIIAAFTPGYNAESDPEHPEEYDENDQPTADALAGESS